jgi:exodeoxyribonuclease-3
MPPRCDPSTLSLLTLNLRSPSVQRAERLFGWLAKRPEDVLVLTETRASQGCATLARRFAAAGYAVTYQEPEQRGYGTMIASRKGGAPSSWAARVHYLPARAASIRIPTVAGELHVIGLYVPSRDRSEPKITRKQRFLAQCLDALQAAGDLLATTVLLGDLNVVEPDHQPRYRTFRQFEYEFYRELHQFGLVDAFRALHGGRVEHSWVGRTGDGYRYDHAFVATGLLPMLSHCAYVHQPRIGALSDHSALTLHLCQSAPSP